MSFHKVNLAVKNEDPAAKELIMKLPKFVITDLAVDSEGRYGGVIAVKHAERNGRGRTPRRRPPDPEFDEALLAELERRKIPLGYKKACLSTATEVANQLAMSITPHGARSRVAELRRMAGDRRRWREKKQKDVLSTLDKDETGHYLRGSNNMAEAAMVEKYNPEQHGSLLLIHEARERLFAVHKVRLSQQRLADLRCFGGGPEFIKPTQREVRYPSALLDAWAAKRNTKPILTFVPINTAKRNARPTKPEIMVEMSNTTDETIGQEVSLKTK